MKKIFLFPVLYLLPVNSFSQDNSSIEAPNNVIHASVGTFLFVNSAQLTYNCLLKQKDNRFFNSYYLTVKGGRPLRYRF